MNYSRELRNEEANVSTSDNTLSQPRKRRLANRFEETRSSCIVKMEAMSAMLSVTPPEELIIAREKEDELGIKKPFLASREQSLWQWLAVRASLRDTPPEELIKRSTFILISFLTIVAGSMWGVMYLSLGETRASFFPFLYSALVGLNMILSTCLFKNRYHQFVNTQLLLILTLPFAVHLSLGGLQESGGVMVWSFLSPLGAAFFCSSAKSKIYMMIYLFSTIALLVPEFFEESSLQTRQAAYFAMNISGVTTIIFAVALLFAKEMEGEYSRSERLLSNILPANVARRIKGGELPVVDKVSGVTILFADLVGFTKASVDHHPDILVGLFLRDVFASFDRLVDSRGLEKIKTIGDAYMVVGGLNGNGKSQAVETMHLASEFFTELKKVNKKYHFDFQLRIGIHTGPVVAGVLGLKRLSYDVWGDSVNTASRMEAHGKPGHIQISPEMYCLVGNCPAFEFECRGKLDIKGKGKMTTYLARPTVDECGFNRGAHYSSSFSRSAATENIF